MYALDRSSRTKGIRKSICQFSMIIDKSNLASVCKAMPKQDNDIFEFDLASNNQEKINYEGVNYTQVTLKTRDVVLVPTSIFANQKKEQVINQVNKLYYQHILFEKYLTPKEIKQAANQLSLIHI
jgi:hypothetical protein